MSHDCAEILSPHNVAHLDFGVASGLGFAASGIIQSIKADRCHVENHHTRGIVGVRVLFLEAPTPRLIDFSIRRLKDG